MNELNKVMLHAESMAERWKEINKKKFDEWQMRRASLEEAVNGRQIDNFAQSFTETRNIIYW